MNPSILMLETSYDEFEVQIKGRDQNLSINQEMGKNS